MEEAIRYSEVGDANYFVSWNLVINQMETKSKRIVGELMQVIELMGLPEKQEVALKGQVKASVYAGANDSLDWISNSIHKLLSDGKLEEPKGCEATPPPTGSIGG